MTSNEQSASLTTSSGASTKDEPASGQQQQAQEKNSVYDFLYHDARRIASFLSQFQTYGVAQSIKANEGAGRSETTKGGLEAGGGVPLIASGKAAIDRSVTNDERDGMVLSANIPGGVLVRIIDRLNLVQPAAPSVAVAISQRSIESVQAPLLPVC